MAITANQKVLTLDYWKLATQLQVGDWVFNQHGEPVQIKLVQQYRAEDCYEVVFKDHLTMSGDKHLVMDLENLHHRKQTHKYKNVLKFTSPLLPMSLETLYKGPVTIPKVCNLYSLPTTKPLQLPFQDLPVHPFVFGFWFLNRKKHGRLMPSKDYLDEVVQRIKDCGYKVTKHNQGDKHRANIKISPKPELQLAPNVPNKIPNNYLLGSYEQRLDLLRGILYAKHFSYNTKNDIFRVTMVNKAIMMQIQFLAESLGHKLFTYFNDRDSTYFILFRSKLDLMHHQRKKPMKVYLDRRYIKKVNKIQPQLCVHIETTGKDNTILVGEGFIACR